MEGAGSGSLGLAIYLADRLLAKLDPMCEEKDVFDALEKASAEGSLSASFILGAISLHEYYDPDRYKPWTPQNASDDWVAEQFPWGEVLGNQNKIWAQVFLERAAHGGHPLAQFELGCWAAWGVDGEKPPGISLDDAIAMLRAAAEAGFAIAMLRLSETLNR